jgi:hypothetical protein
MKLCRCADSAHLNLPCGAPHNTPIGVQADDYHWHLVDDGNLFTAYHAACKPPMPDPESPDVGRTGS